MAAVLRSVCAGIALLSMTLSGVDASAASFDWVTVGDPGNACTTLVDAGSQTTYCAGGVAYSYQISKYETTNAQYAEFLNAVAASDPNSLYSGNMNSSAQGGIVRSGLAGSFSYATKPGFEDKPVDYVTFYDALRFANWVQNGQPTGAQGAGTTETGAYAITAQGIANNSITRDGAATIFLTNDDEWVKAAYYDAVSQSFNLFPASTSVPTACFPAGVPTNTQANTANCEGTQLVGGLTVKGLYLNSASPRVPSTRAATCGSGPRQRRFPASARNAAAATSTRPSACGMTRGPSPIRPPIARAPASGSRSSFPCPSRAPGCSWSGDARAGDPATLGLAG